ncbi:MAG: hypothetical protein KAS58_03425, partial [Calditrichia bacterium]|nr:hypothetical protein [Calditrichia bacterium]
MLQYTNYFNPVTHVSDLYKRVGKNNHDLIFCLNARLLVNLPLFLKGFRMINVSFAFNLKAF